MLSAVVVTKTNTVILLDAVNRDGEYNLGHLGIADRLFLLVPKAYKERVHDYLV